MATKDELRAKLRIPAGRLDAINDLLLDPNARVVNDLLDVIARYGTPKKSTARPRTRGSSTICCSVWPSATASIWTRSSG